MRRLIAYALILAAAWAIADAPAGSVPGVSAVRDVRQLLSCDAGALGHVITDPASVGQNGCESAAATLRSGFSFVSGSGSGSGGASGGAGGNLPPAPLGR